MYDSFKTACPACGEETLIVTQATLATTGERIAVNQPLEADGFLVPVASDVKDASTEDERVLCTACKKEFDLSELVADA